ncbi:hypothetical protein D043_0548 [Vibrio parahaemolyticus EKP-021]|nr:hypothetical protein D043_0548 [Vibrio parahaemolyticus EKP-021]
MLFLAISLAPLLASLNFNHLPILRITNNCRIDKIIFLYNIFIYQTPTYD